MHLIYKTLLINLVLLQASELLPLQTSSTALTEVQKKELVANAPWYTRSYKRMRQALYSLIAKQPKEEQEEKSKQAYRATLLQRKPLITQTLFDLTIFPQELISLILSYEPTLFIPLPTNFAPAPLSALVSFTYLDKQNKMQEVLASGDRKGRIALQNIQHPEIPARYLTSNDGSPIGSFAVHANSNEDHALRLISASTLYGYKVGKIEIQEQELKILATTRQQPNQDENVHIWDLATGRCVKTLCPNKSIAIDNDDERSRAVHRIKKRFLGSLGHTNNYVTVAYFSRLWNLKTNSHTGDFPEFVQFPPADSSQATYSKLSEALAAMLLPNGDITIVPQQRSETYQLRGHSDIVTWLQLRGDYLVTASRDRTIKVWKLSERRCLCTIDNHIYHVSTLWLADDGKLFSGDEAGVIVMHTLSELAKP